MAGKASVLIKEGTLIFDRLRGNGHVQIIAKKPYSREWIRLTGIASEYCDAALCQKMYEGNSILQIHHKAFKSEHFLMFKVTGENAEFK